MGLAQKPFQFSQNDVNIAFSPARTWQLVSNKNDSALELVNFNENLHLNIWFEDSKNSAAKFLKQEMKDEGISRVSGTFKMLIDNQTAVAAHGECTEMHQPIKVLLMTIGNNDRYCVIQLKCPYDCFSGSKERLEELIRSLTLTHRNIIQQMYAELKT